MTSCVFACSLSGLIHRRGLAVLLAVFALIAGIGVQPAYAQRDAGSLRVLALDSSNAAVPGATVTLANTATGVTQNAVSDSEGYD